MKTDKPKSVSMKNRSVFLMLVFFIPVFWYNSEAQPVAVSYPVLPEIVRTRTGIIDYFNSVIKAGKIIVGQHCSNNGLSDLSGAYKAYLEDLHAFTGKYPALFGTDYGEVANVNYSAINQIVINHWKAGGLVTLSWHADCPWVEGYGFRWNTITNKGSIDLAKLVKGAPESPERTSYRKELMAVGGALRKLKDAGVIVLWRPFHEMNGTWFWWGVNDLKNPSNKAAFELLWHDMYSTFSEELGLDNLIWVYGANYSSTWTASVGAMYPGDDVVDVAGVDIYSKSPVFTDYEDLKKFNKPIVISENGPSKDSYGLYDEMEVLNTFKGKAAYFLQWHSWRGAKVAIVDNANVKEMMLSQEAITLDELRK